MYYVLIRASTHMLADFHKLVHFFLKNLPVV